MNNTGCPCCSGAAFADCCQPYLSRSVDAPSALQLMRSRYSAYSLQLADYLYQTWHPASRHPALLSELQKTLPDNHWIGLTVIDTQTLRDNEATVTFFARYQSQHGAGYIYECSRFLHLTSRWYYVDGQHIKPQRNLPCPCASGQKFKRCCAV